MLDTRDMPDGIYEHHERVIVVGVDLTARTLGRMQGPTGEGTYLGMLRWTKIYPGCEMMMTLSGKRESKHLSQ